MFPVASGTNVQDDTKYASSGKQALVMVRQFKATIPPKPVSLPGGTNAAFSLVLISTAMEWQQGGSNYVAQAQMGYGKQRQSGSNEIEEFIYAEAFKKNTTSQVTEDYFTYKRPGYPTQTNTYQGILNPTTGD